MKHYDAMVVGAGAGGGVIAARLADAGKSVLLLERGEYLSFAAVGRDHLRNQRLSQYGHNAGPGADHLRVTEWGKTVLPWEGAYQANAATVGGGTRVYGAQAWRFVPLDFKMASTYGVPEGSSLADWPIGYDDLAAHYERVEHELGVCGDPARMKSWPAFSRDYPMPPQPPNRQGKTVRAGAEKLGWNWLPVPLAINSVGDHGRPACIRCQHCVGFACPVNAKNGTNNTYIPRALSTGHCDLITNAMAIHIETQNGTATGVKYVIGDTETTATADVVVVAAGAIETARLLLLSRIGNDQVGRHLQGHVYTGAVGRFDEPIWDGLGPGVSTATVDWVHAGNRGADIVGGGMLADEFIPLPITLWKRMTPPNLPRWGVDARRWMQHNYRRVSDIKGPIHEIPTADARVTLDPDVQDKWGSPVARFSGATHPESIRTAKFLHGKAVEWLRASGAVEVWGEPPAKPYLSGGQHQAGTCRMGDDPEMSVCDRNCRVHGHENLYLGDTSVHVTNGSFNPFLTAMALADRTADQILANW